ncbi:acetylcholinesterase-like isoform X3 [Dermacentor andersoni]|uniref:acetylcholinesterase-like isoform X3 n=1 Tax=Dermacentor andersoni TaxID=34620 RepID=UPI0024159BAB|nr:carboxylesterase 3B-like isoform X2 [Dermacentor andersoni]
MRRTGSMPPALTDKLSNTDPEVAAARARLQRGYLQEETCERPPVPASSAMATGVDTGTPHGNFAQSASLLSYWSLYRPKATERRGSLHGGMTACLVSVVASILMLAVATVLLLRYLPPKKDDLLIHGPFGTVLGSVMSCRGRLVYAFRGVPFAQPPVGDLRFREAVAARDAGADSLYDGTRPPAPCLQGDKTIRTRAGGERANAGSDRGREDCLTLSIWKPPGACEAGPLAVLFVVHGHFFQMSLADNEGRCLAALGDVVVVAPHYRLGAMGFLNAPPEAPGNVGLSDLVVALNWTRTYFDNTINAKANLATLAERLSCDSNRTRSVLDCMRNASAAQVMQSGALGRPIFFPSYNQTLMRFPPYDRKDITSVCRSFGELQWNACNFKKRTALSTFPVSLFNPLRHN